MEHLEHDWQRQRERLSALLDNELTEQERAELEAHLATCAECRAELASLQRTRALVRALPQPTLHRSFALPREAASIQALPRHVASAARPASASARRPPRAPPAAMPGRRPVRALQWLSTIAAVLGIVLLLSSAFSSLSLSKYGVTTSGASNSAQLGSSSTPTPRTPNTEPGAGTPVLTQKTPGATPTPESKGDGAGTSSRPASGPSFGALISSTGLGALLLILSACGFAIAWAVRRRW